MSTYRDETWKPPYLPNTLNTQTIPPLAWWYRLTTPKPPSSNISFRTREMVRRGRLGSNIVLTALLLIMVDSVLALLAKHYLIVCIQVIVLVIFCVALRYNQQGHRLTTGLLVVVSGEIGSILTLIVLGTANQLMSGSGFFELLALEILAVSLLPAESVFAVALINVLFTYVALFLSSHHVSLVQTLWLADIQTFLHPTLLYFFVATVTYIWARSTMRAIAYADSAEVVATIEHAMAEQEHVTAQQKRILDQSIYSITQTHLRVANGDYSVRVPITQENVLWPIAGSLNTLLARIQRLGREAAKLEKTEQEAARLAAALHSVRTGGPPILFRRSGTAIDLIILELATSVETPPSGPPES